MPPNNRVKQTNGARSQLFAPFAAYAECWTDMSVTGVIIPIVLLSISCATVRTPAGACQRAVVSKWAVAPERLVRLETIADAERNQTTSGVSFGGAHREWEDLKAKLQPGDQLWSFTAPHRSGLYGAHEGYVVMRGCQQVLSMSWWD